MVKRRGKFRLCWFVNLIVSAGIYLDLLLVF